MYSTLSVPGSGNVIICRALRASLAGVLMLAGLAHASEAPLTLGEAQRIAVERSRQLAAQDASITAAREMAVAAGQLPDPVLKLGIDNLPVDGADRFSVGRDFMTMRRIGVMQEFTRDDKRKLKVQRFDRETDRAIAEKSVAVAALQKDTALAWLERYYLERMRAVVAAQAEEANLEIEAAEGAYRAGRGSQADIYTARAARVALEDRLSELDRRIRNARVMLARWVGNAADAPLAGEPNFTEWQRSPITRSTGKSSVTRRLRCWRGKSQSPNPRRSSPKRTNGPIGALSSPIRNAAPIFRTWFRSASRFRCSGTRRTARTANSRPSSR